MRVRKEEKKEGNVLSSIIWFSVFILDYITPQRSPVIRYLPLKLL